MDRQAITMLDLNWEYLRWNALLSTKRRLLYVATPKVACTSVKWWFARLEGYSGTLQAMSEESRETAPELIIHDTFHKVAPRVAGLAPESLGEAIESDDYFRFALVRNPFKRIFSAWQSKLLLREPLQVKPYRDKVFYHHPIRSKADVTQAFEMFLEHLAAEEAPTFWDVHWAPQAMLLRPDVIRYTAVSQIENVSGLEGSLREWLGEEVSSPFANRGTNESLLPYQEEFISDRSARLIRQLYAADFERFGYGLDLPNSKERVSSAEFELALKAIEMIRARHERIGVMRTVADRRLHELRLESAGKDEGLKALRHVVADAVNQYQYLQRESTDLTESRWSKYAEELAVLAASRQELSIKLEQSEADCSRLTTRLEQIESDHRALAEHSAAVEADLVRLERGFAESEQVRAALKGELERALHAMRKLREGLGACPPGDFETTTEELEPAGLVGEIEQLREQLAPLQLLPAQVEELHRVASQFHSVRFLVKRTLVILGNRVLRRPE